MLMGMAFFEDSLTPTGFDTFQFKEVLYDEYIIHQVIKKNWDWIDSYFPGFKEWWKKYKKLHLAEY